MSARAARLIRLWVIGMLSLLPLRPLSAQDEPPAEPRSQAQADTPIGVAATFTVNSTADAVDANMGNGVCATVGAVCTLRAAIQEANSTLAADTIVLASDTYSLTLTGTNEDSAATGDLDILAPLTIVGAGRTVSTINGMNSDRILDIYGLAKDVILQNITLTNGNASGVTLPATWGGAILTSASITVTLQTVDVISNTAARGGGIYNWPGGKVIIMDGYFANNLTSQGGSAIYNRGSLSITNTGMDANRSVGAASSGGALHNASEGLAQIATSYFERNEADSGGALYSQGQLHITNSEIAFNSGRFGGGVHIFGGTLAITNTTLSFNSAEASGGALYNFSAATLESVTIYSNTTPTDLSSGIWSGGSTSLRNTIVAENPGGNCNGSVTSLGNNIDFGNSCGFTGAGDLVNTDPHLDPVLRPNGPSSQIAFTHALLPGSPAIDHGNNSTCPATDQRGVARVDGNLDGTVTCDIGAFEFELLKVFLPIVLKP